MLRRPCIAANDTTARQKWAKWHEPTSLRARRKKRLPNGGNLPILGIGSFLHGHVLTHVRMASFRTHNNGGKALLHRKYLGASTLSFRFEYYSNGRKEQEFFAWVAKHKQLRIDMREVRGRA